MTIVPHLQMIGRGLRPGHSDPCDEWPPELFGYVHPWTKAKARLEIDRWRAGPGAPIAKAWDLGRYGS